MALDFPTNPTEGAIWHDLKGNSSWVYSTNQWVQMSGQQDAHLAYPPVGERFPAILGVQIGRNKRWKEVLNQNVIFPKALQPDTQLSEMPVEQLIELTQFMEQHVLISKSIWDALGCGVGERSNKELFDKLYRTPLMRKVDALIMEKKYEDEEEDE